jgi:hypothetical protein
MIQPKRAALLTLALMLGAVFVMFLTRRAKPGTQDGLSPQPRGDASDTPVLATEFETVPLGTGARAPLPAVPEVSDVETVEPKGEEQDKVPLPAFMDSSGSPETWGSKYAEMSWRQIQIEADQITAYIEPLTEDVLARLWRDDEYEVLPLVIATKIEDGEWWDDSLFLPGLEIQIGMPDGEKRRYRVPEDQYPDLYMLGRKGQWLRSAARAKQKVATNSFLAK